MLILTRAPGDSIMIGTDIVVKVIHVSGTRTEHGGVVQLEVTAPHELEIRAAEPAGTTK